MLGPDRGRCVRVMVDIGPDRGRCVRVMLGVDFEQIGVGVLG